MVVVGRGEMEVKAWECIEQVLKLTLIDGTLGALDLGLSPHFCSTLLKKHHHHDCVTLSSTGNQSFITHAYFFFPEFI